MAEEERCLHGWLSLDPTRCLGHKARGGARCNRRGQPDANGVFLCVIHEDQRNDGWRCEHVTAGGS